MWKIITCGVINHVSRDTAIAYYNSMVKNPNLNVTISHNCREVVIK